MNRFQSEPTGYLQVEESRRILAAAGCVALTAAVRSAKNLYDRFIGILFRIARQRI